MHSGKYKPKSAWLGPEHLCDIQEIVFTMPESRPAIPETENKSGAVCPASRCRSQSCLVLTLQVRTHSVFLLGAEKP